jgi:hypothetical protein
LTAEGRAYALAIVATISALNRAVAEQGPADRLVAVDTLLREIIATDPELAQSAARIPRPPARP